MGKYFGSCRIPHGSWENQKSHYCHDFRILGRVHDSPNQLSLTVGLPNYVKNQQNHNIIFENNIWKAQNIGNQKAWAFGKRRVPENPKDPSVLKILNIRTTSIKNQEMQIWYGIWGQYLAKKT